MRPDLPDIFAAVIRYCPRLVLLHFPTNGFLVDNIIRITRDVAARGRPPRLVVTVSIDGPPAVHDALRGVAGAFDRAVETYARLREIRNCEPHVGMTLSAFNAGCYADTLSSLSSLLPGFGPRNLHVNIAHRSPHYYRNDDAPRPDLLALAREIAEVRQARRRSLAPLDVVERRYLSLASRYLETGISPLPCTALSSSCFVSSEGTVFPCISHDAPLGSLREARFNLARIWARPAARRLREAIAAGTCPGCWTPCEAMPSMGGSLLRSGLWHTPKTQSHPLETKGGSAPRNDVPGHEPPRRRSGPP
ncbi:MAG: SPASM domain-containing protein [Deltaproteobacteria bacterium]|nr:SPASM domain-containing protein [Deltaproteobacteria bacterium]